MPSLPIRLAFAAVLTAAAAAALAQPAPMRPGLWEMQVKNPELDAARAQMAEQMAQMPPAMRKQMEEMMASRGVALTGSGVRACITPEQARRGPNPGMVEKGCTQDLDWAGNVGRYRMQCEDGRNGRGEVRFVSDRAWQGWGEFTDPNQGGKTMKFDYSGNWVGADCGNVAPVKDR